MELVRIARGELAFGEDSILDKAIKELKESLGV